MEDFKDILGELDEITGDKKPIVFATFVLDHSGSMYGDEKMCISNFNEQVQSMKSKKDVITYFTKVDFSDQVVLTGPYPIDHVKEMTVYEADGLTALNDAIAKAISVNKKMMNDTKNDDKSSLIIVITDGQENASKEYQGPEGTEKLQSMIKELQDQGDWTFTFMAADLTVQKYATQSLGIHSNNTMCFDKTIAGYDSLNNSTIRGIDAYYDMRVRGGKSTGDFVSNPVDDGTSAKDLIGVDDAFTTSHTLPEDLKEKMKNALAELQVKLAEADAEEDEDGDEKERSND